MMNTSSEQQADVAGAVHSATPKAKRRKYVPKHAIRLAGEVGVGRLCRCGCGAVLVSIGRGRPKELCDEGRRALYTSRQRAYYLANRGSLLHKLNEKRFKERQERGKCGQPDCVAE